MPDIIEDIIAWFIFISIIISLFWWLFREEIKFKTSPKLDEFSKERLQDIGRFILSSLIFIAIVASLAGFFIYTPPYNNFTNF